MDGHFQKACGIRHSCQALLPAASPLMGTLLVRCRARKECREKSRHGRQECLRHVDAPEHW